MLYYLLCNHLGSTCLTTDANRVKQAGVRYDARRAVSRPHTLRRKDYELHFIFTFPMLSQAQKALPQWARH